MKLSRSTLRAARLAIRFVKGVMSRLRDESLQLQSTSLAYTTLLSLVPLLAVTFSVLKGFGVQNQLRPMFLRSLEPLGARGTEIGEHILNYVDNLNFAVLGFAGIALLFWTVISLLTRVEQAFNSIWQVPGVRRWSRRFSDYLSVALVGPVFLFSALGLTTVWFAGENVHRMIGIEPLGLLVVELGKLIPYLLVCAAFAFLYAFLTNCRVRLVPALAGGVFAGVAWFAVGNLFAQLVAGSSRYSAIYSSMAAAVLFIIWINIGWLIILVGAHIARYVQHPRLLHYQLAKDQPTVVGDEALALEIMALIAQSYHSGGPKLTSDVLTAQGYSGSSAQVDRLVGRLRDAGLIAVTDDEPAAYLPGRSMETIPLEEIVAVARSRSAHSGLETVCGLLEEMEAAVSGSLKGRHLRDLVAARAEHRPSAAPAGDKGEGSSSG